jgi:hypothetical protein
MTIFAFSCQIVRGEGYHIKKLEVLSHTHSPLFAMICLFKLQRLFDSFANPICVPCTSQTTLLTLSLNWWNSERDGHLFNMINVPRFCRGRTLDVHLVVARFQLTCVEIVHLSARKVVENVFLNFSPFIIGCLRACLLPTVLLRSDYIFFLLLLRIFICRKYATASVRPQQNRNA